jgi:hypothetical protein
MLPRAQWYGVAAGHARECAHACFDVADPLEERPLAGAPPCVFSPAINRGEGHGVSTDALLAGRDRDAAARDTRGPAPGVSDSPDAAGSARGSDSRARLEARRDVGARLPSDAGRDAYCSPRPSWPGLLGDRLVRDLDVGADEYCASRRAGSSGSGRRCRSATDWSARSSTSTTAPTHRGGRTGAEEQAGRRAEPATPGHRERLFRCFYMRKDATPTRHEVTRRGARAKHELASA